MSRQLIICCDGTSNNLTVGAKDTNVTKLCDLLAPDSNDQLLYYDPGELPGASLTDNFSRRHGRGGKRRAGERADTGVGLGFPLASAGRGGALAGAGHDGRRTGQMGGAAGLWGPGAVGG